jgi:hypothetical protein
LYNTVLKTFYNDKNIYPYYYWNLIKFKEVKISRSANYLSIWDDGYNENKYYKPSEDWANNENNKLHSERGIKNWFDLEKQFKINNPIIVKNLFGWVYTDWLGYKYLVPVWWEYQMKQSAQQWLNNLILSDNQELTSPKNIELTGEANLSDVKFSKLKRLDLSKNQLSAIDLSNNLDLTYINLSENQNYLKITLPWTFIRSIKNFIHDQNAEISQQSKPSTTSGQEKVNKIDKQSKNINLSNKNLIGEVNFSGFDQLDSLWIINNSLTLIDISEVSSLTDLKVSGNSKAIIKFLDQRQEEKLTTFEHDSDQVIEYKQERTDFPHELKINNHQLSFYYQPQDPEIWEIYLQPFVKSETISLMAFLENDDNHYRDAFIKMIKENESQWKYSYQWTTQYYYSFSLKWWREDTTHLFFKLTSKPQIYQQDNSNAINNKLWLILLTIIFIIIIIFTSFIFLLKRKIVMIKK